MNPYLCQDQGREIAKFNCGAAKIGAKYFTGCVHLMELRIQAYNLVKSNARKK